ncbi:MBG domain-containing protein [Massilia sp. S19_KUP03_FR1]|uniref:MBG domain-containing protein n=1 Tax=Massilia sp. S19_KUP03_FR1 TaxID=3025503 RepID=UPI002FCDC2F4
MRILSPRTTMAAALACGLSGVAAGAPTLSGVVAGSAQITQPNSTTTLVAQGTGKAILAWRDFSIAAGETVRFQQPDANSVALNRVTGSDPSAILGSLSANGKVFLVNPNGILFGAQARVDVGSLVASTMDIADQDFLAGRYQFAGTSGAALRVDGAQLRAGERGTIALLGASVSNNGTLTARLGTVALAAGEGVTLDFNGDGLTRIVVQPARLQALVANGGAVYADGGQVVMTAASMQALAASVAQHGTLQANALVERNGKLVLDAGATGRVDLTGTLAATGAHGGTVSVRGQALSLAATAAIDVRGDSGGGTVLIDAAGALDLHGKVRADALSGSGGAVETNGAVVDASGFSVSAASGAGPAGSWTLTAPAIALDAPLAASIGRTLDAATNAVVQARVEGAGDIVVDAAVLKATPGAAALRLDAGANIVMAPNARIAATGSGARIDVDLNAGAIVLEPGASIASGGGSIGLSGGSDKLPGYATSNALHENGILLDGATLDARNCQCDTRPAGAITLRGAGAAAGVALVNGSRIAGAGNVAITGVAEGFSGRGLVMHGATLSTIGAGTLTLLGRAASGRGVDLADVQLGSVDGALTIAGESAGRPAGVALDGVQIGGATMRGTVAISALNHAVVLSDTPVQPMLAAGAGHPSAIRTTGVIHFRPGGVDASGAPTSALDVPIGVGTAQLPFQLDLAAFGIQPGSTVVIGSSAQRGTLQYNAAALFDGNLTLQSGGGITFTAPLSATGLVTLSSGGLVDSQDVALSAGSLLLHGSGPGGQFQLTNAGNRIGTLALTTMHGEVDVLDSTALVLGPLQGRGFNEITGAATTIDAATSVAGGNVLVRSAGRLILAQDVASLDGDITLVAGTAFDNRANGSLLVGAGRRWQVYADTWSEEVRGALAPTQPNFYHCGYGAACGTARAGNGFIYRQQPAVTITGATLARVYGDANPAFTYGVTGLVNGDSAADVLAGAFGSAATAASNVGRYAVTGSFTSPAGYAVTVRDGALTVTPAALLIAIDDQHKVYGGADPRLSATYTGLKLADTGAVASGLRLAAPTGAAARAGSHAITGSGATASNYAITYQAGTLTVAPALLTYSADPVTAWVGTPVGSFSGSVTGFVYGESLASATTGALAFKGPTGRVARAGTYPLEGSGLAAANYVFRQAPGNLNALVVQAAPSYVAPAIGRDVTFSSSDLYDKNIGEMRVCVGAGALAAAGVGAVNDALGVEWSRVRLSPNLSNCFILGQRNGCNDF